MAPSGQNLRTVVLDRLHRDLGARMVPFAGYAMPVQYKDGILAEHRNVRQAAGLFDVSHMGQIRVAGTGSAAALERVMPAAVGSLAPGRQRYSVLTGDEGGILDDLMIANAGDAFLLVVNAANKEADLAHLRERIGGDCAIEPLFERALLALQGPAAAAVMSDLAPEAVALPFMGATSCHVAGVPAFVTRSGYTGEDGFEISVAPDQAEALFQALLARDDVRPAGLGARDTLRLEAALCLHGQDIGPDTTPVEAGLTWVIPKERRGADAGYPGAAVIARQIAEGAPRRRVGLLPEPGSLPRAGGPISLADGRVAGMVTSGGFAPSLGHPVAMGYVESDLAAPGASLRIATRAGTSAARVAALPFVPHRYYKGG